VQQHNTPPSSISGTWVLPVATTTPPSAEELAAIEKWEITNEKATGLISRTCSEDIQILLADQRKDVTTNPITQQELTAHEFWEFLRTRYEKKDGISAIIDWGCQAWTTPYQLTPFTPT
jgi:hypothetical protein